MSTRLFTFMAEFLVICQTNVGQLKANYNGKQNYDQGRPVATWCLKAQFGEMLAKL